MDVRPNPYLIYSRKTKIKIWPTLFRLVHK